MTIIVMTSAEESYYMKAYKGEKVTREHYNFRIQSKSELKFGHVHSGSGLP